MRPLLPAIQVPTLVIHNAGDPAIDPDNGRYLAGHIPDARFELLDGAAHFPWLCDQDRHLDLLSDFLNGGLRRGIDRVLSTILFTDIVDSTKTAASLGDRRWRQVLDEHDRLARRELARHRGVMVKSTGDGLLATFDGPARGIQCALSLVRVICRLWACNSIPVSTPEKSSGGVTTSVE